jgi:apolipoprotein N-acyltransferase
MRIVAGVYAAILVFFALLQYNDPDPLYWGAVYLLAALWPALAVWRPDQLRQPAWRWAAIGSGVLFILGFLWLAPTIGRDWIHVEEAREAIGYLLCLLGVLLALWTVRQRPRPLAA